MAAERRVAPRGARVATGGGLKSISVHTATANEEKKNGECALNSESADEIDEGTFLNTFGNWLTANVNKAAHESAFGNHLDDALAFSGMGGTI